ncbi:proline racemase family protein [Myxococcus virescens]|uniref:4-hydroxyproline 2-epimerase n=1 Tax=Myxococcus virescens TaxID=83456 RepID=A0A511HIQ3_9BACT|nr:proline racemase family protein [Myxococcus virescens]GEL73456.1 4-hydroxyproline 2-epimerase [Myxococcus virescens]SDE89847.1 proline racemase [Myxococcus virescens]
MRRIRVIDSHTGGEPTRVVTDGGPELGAGDLPSLRERFREEFDAFRKAIVCEPRGSDVMVGALLCPPVSTSSVAGIIFFNNVGYLGMCGHGTIGVVKTLEYLGRIGPGVHSLETPVGVVKATLHPDGRVSIANVPSYRWAQDVAVSVPGHGEVRGDIAWGGNWFFLSRATHLPLELSRTPALLAYTSAIKQALSDQGITGEGGAEIDHVELYAPSPTPGVDARNFVLCPGLAYDRSPCGTGTSAKVACLAAEGVLAEGATWVQESILGSRFEARYVRDGARILPTITGTASVNAEATLLVDPTDPFAWGIG